MNVSLSKRNKSGVFIEIVIKCDILLKGIKKNVALHFKSKILFIMLFTNLTDFDLNHVMRRKPKLCFQQLINWHATII